jgi:hypothetical protein
MLPRITTTWQRGSQPNATDRPGALRSAPGPGLISKRDKPHRSMLAGQRMMVTTGECPTHATKEAKR